MPDRAVPLATGHPRARRSRATAASSFFTYEVAIAEAALTGVPGSEKG
ncbi:MULTISPECIES: hypothetical protein [unclassified Streptomyces]